MQNIIQTATASENCKTLIRAIGAAKLAETLDGPGPFTVFAPTDEAFAKIPKAELNALLADTAKLKKVLNHHVIAGKIMAADVGKLKDGSKVKAVDGSDLTVHVKGGSVKIDQSTITKTDIAASNGVIHQIDAVIMPS
jgi:uncharacterized surface protein with fasciclin (FAS1) repeats